MTNRANSEGYILFLVAILVAMLSLFTLLAARVQSQMARSIETLRDQVQLEIAAESATSRVAFLLATQPIGERSILIGAERAEETPDGSAGTHSATGRAIVELRLDGSGYVWRSGRRDFVVSVQDENGLLNINAADEIGAQNLLRSYGVNSAVSTRLAASLADFVDQDDLRRRAGAERRDYAASGLAPPPNGAVDSVWTALSALGWREALSPSVRSQVFASMRAGADDNMLNVNTASLHALEAAFNLSERNAQQIIDRRAGAPFRALDEVRAFTGETPRAEAPTPVTMPGSAFRVIVRPTDSAERGYAFEMQLTFGGGQSDRPVYGGNGWLRRSTSASGGEQGRDLAAFPSTPAVLAP